MCNINAIKHELCKSIPNTQNVCYIKAKLHVSRRCTL
nr:MAG TPA: hypothetical protein [Caudoviricetes sp.]